MATSLNASLNVSLNPQSLNASTKQIQQALGRITGQASEFQKSLDASTARVFAFGATTVVINGVTQSFKKLVSTTIDVQKRLTEINSIFQATEGNFNRFRNSIFQVAKETGQSFATVADGAAELARQGLSAEETASRLKSALILTRISGMDAEKSVKALTAAINGFTSAGLSHTQIVNKMVAVDTAFAVSTDDLAAAFQRAGSTAEDAGVSFNELLGLITAVEQRTSRGGAVIGNAFKSIFTRLQRGTTISELKELGVAIDANQSGVQKLQALSSAIEGIADPTVVSKIKELAGGVFQINVVSAALKDLGSNTSIFQKAALTAASATNEAFEKNKLLNETISAQINSLVQGLTSLAERIGSVTFGPLLEGLVGIATKVTDFLNTALDPEKGNVFVKGLFKTIGSFLSGPAVVIFTAAFVKIFKLVAKFASEGLRALFSMGSQTEKIKQIEGGIVGLLQRDSSLRKQMESTTMSQAQKEQAVISAIQRENALLSQQAQLMRGLANMAAARGVTGFSNTGGFTGKRGRFSMGFRAEEAEARALGAPPDVRARLSDGTIQGRRVIMNNKETEVRNFAGGKDSAIIPSYAGGFVPNYNKFGIGGFAGPALSAAQISPRIKSGQISAEQAALSGYRKGAIKRADGANFPRYNADSLDSKKALMLVPQAQALLEGALKTNFQSKKRLESRFSGFDGSVAGIDPNLKQDSGFRRMLRMDQILDASLTRGVNNSMESIVSKSGGKLKMQPRKFTTKQVKQRVLKEGGAGAFGALRGAIFESIIEAVTGGVKSGTGNNTLDVNIAGNKAVEEIFGITGKNYKWGDFKNSQGQKDKFIQQTMRSLPRKGAPMSAAAGFVPNYASGGGVPQSLMRIHSDDKGRKVLTNIRDEPNGVQDAIKRERKGIGMFAGGFIPNYAKGGDGGLMSGASGFIIALGSMQMALNSLTSATDQSANATEMDAEVKIDQILASEKSISTKMKEIQLLDNASRAQSSANSGLEGVANAANHAMTALMAMSALNMVTGGIGGRAFSSVGKGVQAGMGRVGASVGRTRAVSKVRQGIQSRLPMTKDPMGGRSRHAIKKSFMSDGFNRRTATRKANDLQRSANARTRSIGKVGKLGKLGGAPLAIGLAGFSAFDAFQQEKAGTITTQERDQQLGGTGGALAGGLAGAKLGAMAGAFGGPVGMAIGGLLGGGVGAVAGSSLGKGLVSAFQGPEPLDPKIMQRYAEVSSSGSRNRRLGFNNSQGFMDRATENMTKMQAAGQDTSVIQKEYVQAMKALKDEYSKEEQDLEKLSQAQDRLAAASRDLAGMRFETIGEQEDYEKKLEKANNALARASERLAVARSKAVDIEGRVNKGLKGRTVKGMAERASIQSGLTVAAGKDNPFASATMLASEQNAALANINLLRQDQMKADAKLAAERQKPLGLQDTKELIKNAAEAGEKFKKAAIQAGTSFLNKMEDVSALMAQNDDKISEGRKRMSEGLSKLSDHLIKQGGVDVTATFQDAMRAIELVNKKDRTDNETQTLGQLFQAFDSKGLGSPNEVIAAATGKVGPALEAFKLKLDEARLAVSQGQFLNVNEKGKDGDKRAKFADSLLNIGKATFGAELDQSTKSLIQQQEALRAEMALSQTAFNSLHNNEATKGFAEALKTLQGELKNSVGSFEKVKDFAESNLTASNNAAALVEEAAKFMENRRKDLLTLENKVDLLQGKVDDLQ